MSADMALVIPKAARTALDARTGRVFRFTLGPGEVLRLPPNKRNLRVVSGDAWVNVDERDIVAPPDSRVELPQTGCRALVSGLRGQSLLLEVW